MARVDFTGPHDTSVEVLGSSVVLGLGLGILNRFP